MGKTVLSLLLIFSLKAQEINIGSTCKIQGIWTRDALHFANEIKSVVGQIRLGQEGAAHPCRVLVEALNDVPLYRGAHNADYDRGNLEGPVIPEGNPDNALFRNQSMAHLAGSNPQGAPVHSLLGAILDNNFSGAMDDKAQNVMKVSGDHSLRVLKSLMMALPMSQACFVNHPQLAQAVFSSSVNLFAALSGPSNILTLGMADLLKDFSDFWQNQRMAFVSRDIDKFEFWKNVSCLLESTTEMYCSIEDAYEFMNFHRQGGFKRLKELSVTQDESYSPLEGYLLLNREVPIITRWFEQVIVGVVPRLKAESDYKISIIEDLTEAFTISQDMIGVFNDALIFYRGLTDFVAKKNKVMDILKNLVESFNSDEARFESNNQNFFIITVPANVLPFYLIGRDKDEPLPQMVVYGENGLPAVHWERYMRVDGNYIEEFQDPDALLLTIEERFKEVLALSLDKATDYFVQRFIYDQANLTTEFMLGVQASTISPHDAMVRVKNYLSKMQESILSDMANAAFVGDEARQFIIERYHPVQLGKISETIDKISNTLGYFEEIGHRAREIVTGFSRPSEEYRELSLQEKRDRLLESRLRDRERQLEERGGSPENDDEREKARARLKGVIDNLDEKWLNRILGSESDRNRYSESLNKILGREVELRKHYSNFVENVYDEFNMWIQRHTFLNVRMEQAVKYEYQYLTRFRNISPYLQDLLLVSGTNLLRTLGKTFTSSPADSIQDLREAKVIMTQNIRSLDRLFSDSMVPMILEYKFISEKNENSDFTITVNSLKRYFRDSIDWDMSGAGLVWNMLYHKDRYPYYFLS
ncbi:MAG: hypothetical protein OXB88_01985, partial [Bacteriovoracales bacterium]|nr:hypothetical protein [Bacteriovoracales bacterium]